jgi:ribosomal protein L37AE/L43A|tara:strand:+ start:132 stop:293 length:162 start_codon:yes stop_codon:yes gene_type:complete
MKQKRIIQQEMCPYCDIEREIERSENSTWTWTCPKCGSKMISNVADFGGRIGE